MNEKVTPFELQGTLKGIFKGQSLSVVRYMLISYFSSFPFKEIIKIICAFMEKSNHLKIY